MTGSAMKGERVLIKVTELTRHKLGKRRKCLNIELYAHRSGWDFSPTVEIVYYFSDAVITSWR